MWKTVDGKLIHINDSSRVKFRTNISKSILEQLHEIAIEHDTYINHLLEIGLKNVLEQNDITFNKELRPKDRVQYQSTYDKELLQAVKEFVKQHHLYINDLIEYSVKHIKTENLKDGQ